MSENPIVQINSGEFQMRNREKLNKVAIAIALLSTSSLASATNCSANYCFAGGMMKWTTSNDLESVDDVLGVSITTPVGSTANVQTGPLTAGGYYVHITSIPVTKVNYSSSQPYRISSALMEGSAFTLSRTSSTPQSTSIKELSIRLQSAPNVATIYASVQGTMMPFIWNMNGDGSDYAKNSSDYAPSVVKGNGEINPFVEPDGYYHARVTISGTSLIGANSSTTPYASGALYAFWSPLGVRGRAWFDTLYSNPFGSIELDLKFTPMH